MTDRQLVELMHKQFPDGTFIVPNDADSAVFVVTDANTIKREEPRRNDVFALLATDFYSSFEMCTVALTREQVTALRDHLTELLEGEVRK